MPHVITATENMYCVKSVASVHPPYTPCYTVKRILRPLLVTFCERFVRKWFFLHHLSHRIFRETQQRRK